MLITMEDSDSSFSEADGSFEEIMPVYTAGVLPFNPQAIENIILTICERFNLRLRKQAALAVVFGAGLGLAGALIGRQLGGKTGALIGASAAGACGVGVAVLSIREAWPQIKDHLSELYEVVYDFAGNLDIKDYYQLAKYLAEHASTETQLAGIIIEIMRSALKQQILHSLKGV